MSPPNRRRHPYLVRTAAAGLTALAGAKAVWAAMPQALPAAGQALEREAALMRFDFARDHVLGTSFDLAVDAVLPCDAERCEQAVLAEIERLRLILSTYDPASEISLVSAGAPVVSPELAQLLAAYDIWSVRTGGALDARLAHVARLWREAGLTGRTPDPAALRAALAAPGALNVDALGKGFIIDRAVAVARRLAPAGLLNIGGDLRAWGDVTWLVGVADPLNPAENAPPLATFALRDAAVATSGGYARFTTIAGEKHSHVIDPRTLTPAACLASATVIATNCLTANALSTAGCLLNAARLFALAARHGAIGQLVVTAAGEQFRAGLLASASDAPATLPAETIPAPAASIASSGATAPAKPAAAAAWPIDFQVTVNVAIGAGSASAAPTAGLGASGTPGVGSGGSGMPRGGPGGFGGPGARGFGKRAYVAIWVEDANHKLVRSIQVLGQNPRYLGELTAWYQAVGRPDPQLTRSITRATRPNGLYSVVWDGLDDRGQPVKQGAYTIKVEINREHGRHATVSTILTCDAQPHSADLAATAESDVSRLDYGPKPAPPATPVP